MINVDEESRIEPMRSVWDTRVVDAAKLAWNLYRNISGG
jgi:hypothetical protein